VATDRAVAKGRRPRRSAAPAEAVLAADTLGTDDLDRANSSRAAECMLGKAVAGRRPRVSTEAPAAAAARQASKRRRRATDGETGSAATGGLGLGEAPRSCTEPGNDEDNMEVAAADPNGYLSIGATVEELFSSAVRRPIDEWERSKSEAMTGKNQWQSL